MARNSSVGENLVLKARVNGASGAEARWKAAQMIGMPDLAESAKAKA